MALGRGVDYCFAIIKGSTWGTAADPDAANELFRPTAFSWQDNIEELSDTSFNKDPLNRETDDVGRFRVSGEFTLDAKYFGLEQFFWGVLGNNAHDAAYNTSFDQHLIYRKSDMTGVFFTMEFDDGIRLHTIDSLKFTGFTATATMGNIVQCTFRWQGRARTDASTTGLSSATEYSEVDRVQTLASICDYQISDQGSAFADIELNSWTLNVDRTYDDDDRVFTSATTSSPYRREMKAGALTVTGSMTIPHEGITHMTTDFHAGTLKQLKLRHVETADQKEFNFWIPSLTFTGASANPTDMGGIPQVLNFRCDDDADQTATADFDMETGSLVMDGIAVEIINTNAVDPSS